MIQLEIEGLELEEYLNSMTHFEWKLGFTNNTSGAESNVEEILNQWQSENDSMFRVLCLSATCKESVLWSHYGDNHEGVAFEVDHYLVKELVKIKYKNERLLLDLTKLNDEIYLLNLIEKMFKQKSIGWAYEQEYRIHVETQKCVEENSQFYLPIPDDFLTKVILGFKCPLKEEDVRKELDEAGFKDTYVTRARLDYKSYDILVD